MQQHIEVYPDYVVDGPVRVAFAYLEEGRDGDFNPDDPTDTPLLRVDAHVTAASGYGGEDTDDPAWLYPQDGSICTLIPATTPPARQRELLAMVAADLRQVVEADRSVKHAMGRYSWLDANSTTTDTLPGLT